MSGSRFFIRAGLGAAACISAVGILLAFPATHAVSQRLRAAAPHTEGVVLPDHTSSPLVKPSITFTPPAFTRANRAAQETSGTPASRPDPLPRLSGILIAGNLRQAIFESGNTPQSNSVGDHIGAYRIIAIDAAAVTVDGPDGLQTLYPDSDGNSTHSGTSSLPADPSQMSLLDRLNTQPPPVVALPRPPSLTQMLSKLPRSH